jgi:hypothetical protein
VCLQLEVGRQTHGRSSQTVSAGREVVGGEALVLFVGRCVATPSPVVRRQPARAFFFVRKTKFICNL